MRRARDVVAGVGRGIDESKAELGCRRILVGGACPKGVQLGAMRIRRNYLQAKRAFRARGMEGATTVLFRCEVPREAITSTVSSSYAGDIRSQ
jgi:hypothetical protein